MSYLSEWRKIREEQDKAYAESLQKDQAKERAKTDESLQKKQASDQELRLTEVMEYL